MVKCMSKDVCASSRYHGVFCSHLCVLLPAHSDCLFAPEEYKLAWEKGECYIAMHEVGSPQHRPHPLLTHPKRDVAARLQYCKAEQTVAYVMAGGVRRPLASAVVFTLCC